MAVLKFGANDLYFKSDGLIKQAWVSHVDKFVIKVSDLKSEPVVLTTHLHSSKTYKDIEDAKDELVKVSKIVNDERTVSYIYKHFPFESQIKPKSEPKVFIYEDEEDEW